MIYVYEALCLVISSIIYGTVIGLGVAVLVDIQFVLFLQLPFTFSFPWLNGCSIYALSLVVAVIASLIPSVRLIRKPISNVLKGQL